MYSWGKASQARKEGLHPDMVRVLDRYITIAEIDTVILEGVRSDEQCYINFGRGRTAAQCLKGGCPAKYARPALSKVTWIGHALSSNHRKVAGYGRAVDLYPYPVSLVLNAKPREYEPLFDRIAADMFKAAEIEGVKIRWGANWDTDNTPRERGETDNPHFELLV